MQIKQIHKKLALAAMINAAFAAPALSADLKFDGFASFIGGINSDDQAVYQGYDDEFTTDTDTIFGLQVSARLTDKVSVTAQLTSRGEDNYDLEANWAYITYAINDDWDFRAGRLGTPLFLYSDFIDVGYAYPWIDQPSEVYGTGAAFFNQFEGIDTVYRANYGDWSATYQGFYGGVTVEAFDAEATNFLGASVTLNRDWLTLRAIASRVSFGIPEVEGSIAIMQALEGAGFSDLANTFSLSRVDTTSFYGLAASIDYENWLFISEYTTAVRSNPGFTPTYDSWYAMIGHRFDNVLVHFTYGIAKEDPDFSVNTIPRGIDPGLDAFAATLDSVISNVQTDSLTLGLRYDFATGTAFKIEVTSYDFDVAEPLFPGQPAIQDDGTLVRFGFDLVF